MSSPNPVDPTIEPITGALRIVNGQRLQDAAPCVVTLCPPLQAAQARRKEQLFLLLNLTGLVSAHLYRELREVVAQTYWAATGSTTAALRLAAAAANRHLLRTNSQSVPADQCRGGLICAVLQDKDLFILLSGPTGACVFRGGRIRRFSQGETMSPLGVGRLPDTRLHHAYVVSGDKLLLSSSGLSQATDDAGLIRVLAQVGIEEMLEGLEQVGFGVDFSALVIRWPLPGEPPVVRKSPPPVSRLKALTESRSEPRKWPWSRHREKLPAKTKVPRQFPTFKTKVEASVVELPEQTITPHEPPLPEPVESDTVAPSTMDLLTRTVEPSELSPPKPAEERKAVEQTHSPPAPVTGPTKSYAPIPPKPEEERRHVGQTHSAPPPKPTQEKRVAEQAPSPPPPATEPIKSYEPLSPKPVQKRRVPERAYSPPSPASPPVKSYAPLPPETMEERVVVEQSYPFPAAVPEPVEPYERVPSREPGPSLGERMGDAARSVGRGVAAAGGIVVGGVSTLAGRMLPNAKKRGRRPARALPPRTARSIPQEDPALMMILAIGIPVVLAITVALAYRSLGADARFRGLVRQAEESAGLAQTPGVTSESSRSHWQTALGHAQSAVILRPDDQVATALQAQAQVALDSLDGIIRLQPVTLHDFGSSTALRRLVIHGQMVFVLDPDGEWVSRLTLNQAGDSVIDPGGMSIIRMDQSIQDGTVGDLVDFVWVDLAGGRQTSGLLILEQDGALVSYDPTWEGEGGALQLQRSFIGMPPESPKVIGTYDGRLYVLDTVLNQIRRYEPRGDTYPERPDHYFVVTPTRPLAETVDMAIDGYIYLLYADGAIAKFLSGNPEAFDVRELPLDLSQAVALAVDPDSGSGTIYVADRGNRRIVALAPDGQFQAQFYARDAFDALETLAVDEATRRLYVISGGRLYVAPLP
ncbi:MAG: hypothetical protein GY832_18520 [Chloroflexi bacterium]|nr:hypothetical protein [Chloroflexota bacterium]